ncbi:taurine transporter subunit [Methylobrevis pamukkalensis]|uniref:Taurine transporter subunit n=1 Tax=Methylobrevis pamukkalensis TaxID=1439726 RepID=A0A1E3H6T5_9HYPH|nr:taurine transporter subunit [Methylobrevis pamukkalensis]
MTTALSVKPAPVATPGWVSNHLLPVAVVVAAIIALWYAGAVVLNAPQQRDAFARAKVSDYTTVDLVRETLNQKRPVMPSPHQVAAEFWKATVLTKPTSKQSLIYHGWITLSSTLLGFAAGTLFGIGLAVAIVHSRVMDKSLMPWIIASQTIPILAIAPMIIVVLNAVGITGLLPKALISMYLSFFPVAVGMVKGLRSPDVINLDLMRTWSATKGQMLLKLRLPSSVPFLFTSMKVGIAASLVGAIVGELRRASSPASARGCFPAPTMARRCRSGRHWSPPRCWRPSSSRSSRWPSGSC